MYSAPNTTNFCYPLRVYDITSYICVLVHVCVCVSACLLKCACYKHTGTHINAASQPQREHTTCRMYGETLNI